jgi:hypothetical protein
MRADRAKPDPEGMTPMLARSLRIEKGPKPSICRNGEWPTPAALIWWLRNIPVGVVGILSIVGYEITTASL